MEWAPSNRIFRGLRFVPLIASTALALRCFSPHGAEAAPHFQIEYVDVAYGGDGKPGWVRAADMDGDGDLDIVAAGGDAMFIYENNGTTNRPDWTRWGNLAVDQGINANGGELFDVDEDGDFDVVSAPDEHSLGWWENPGGPLRTENWRFRRIASVPSPTPFFMHDMIRADLDGDGNAEEFVTNRDSSYWGGTIQIRWHRKRSDGSWESHTIEPGRAEGPQHGHAGLDVADLDGDGDPDLAFSNGWYENSGDASGSWIWHPVSDVYGISNTLARDINGDGRLDLVISAGHHGQGVYWLEQPNSNPATGAWRLHPISAVDGDIRSRWVYKANSPALHHPEGLVVLDFDGDGDFDLATTELYFGEDPGEPAWSDLAHNVYVYENQGTPAAPSWHVENVAPNVYPAHLIQPTDLNHDGRIDLISEGAGFGVVSYYESVPEPSIVLQLAVGVGSLGGFAARRRLRERGPHDRRNRARFFACTPSSVS